MTSSSQALDQTAGCNQGCSARCSAGSPARARACTSLFTVEKSTCTCVHSQISEISTRGRTRAVTSRCTSHHLWMHVGALWRSERRGSLARTCVYITSRLKTSAFVTQNTPTDAPYKDMAPLSRPLAYSRTPPALAPSPRSPAHPWACFLNAYSVHRPDGRCMPSDARRGLTAATNAYGVNRPDGRFESGMARRGLTATRTCNVRRRDGSSSQQIVKTRFHGTLAGSGLEPACTSALRAAVSVPLRCKSTHVHPASAVDPQLHKTTWSTAWE